MQAPATPAATTAVPPEPASGGFPPFDTATYPTQLFWLAVTFAVLFGVMWRVAAPRIGGVIGERKGRIAGDLAAAEKHRADAEQAEADYRGKLAAARTRALALAEESRKVVIAEAEKAKDAAEAEARNATQQAEAHIAELRAGAARHVTQAAQEAASAIVARLTGETVTPEEAANAVGRS